MIWTLLPSNSDAEALNDSTSARDCISRILTEEMEIKSLNMHIEEFTRICLKIWSVNMGEKCVEGSGDGAGLAISEVIQCIYIDVKSVKT